MFNIPTNMIGVLPEKFFQKIEVVGECWKWIGSLSASGVAPVFAHLGINEPARRWAWEIINKKMAPQCLIRHPSCIELVCVNPRHFFDSVEDCPPLPEEDGVRHGWIPRNPGYFVSDAGLVYSYVWHRRSRTDSTFAPFFMIMEQHLNGNNYPFVGIANANRLVHQVVLEAFVGPRPSGFHGCHNDGNPLNSNLDNLRWDTASNNQLDRRKHGTSGQGSKCIWSKLTEEKVIEIRRLFNEGVKKSDLADQFGVSWHTIQRIVKEKIWFHLRETNEPGNIDVRREPHKQFGEECSFSKLTSDSVAAMRAGYVDGKSIDDLATEHNVHPESVRRVIAEETWPTDGEKKKAKPGMFNTTKLKPEEVAEIRRKYDNGASQGELAIEYDTSRATICRVVNRKVWADL